MGQADRMFTVTLCIYAEQKSTVSPSTPNLEANELQEQKFTSAFTPLSQEQGSEATEGTVLLKLAS